MPGDVCLDQRIGVPDDSPTGAAVLRAALVGPELADRVVRFANEGLDADGRLPLGTVEIGRAGRRAPP